MLRKIIRFFGSLLAVFFIIAGYARLIEPNRLTVKTISVETEKVTTPCRIVFFTDTHFGMHYDESHGERIVKKINELEADFVLFGGDLFDNYARDRQSMDLESLKTELKKIEAKAGTYAVWGNHDYGGGAVRIYEDFITSCGFQLLKNESQLAEEYGIRFVGYDDYLMGRTDPSLYTLESQAFNVILSHEPVISKFIKNDSENLLLSGHTHGGQVTIPFLTSKLLPVSSGQFVKGFYTAEEIGTDVSLQMYTSSGIGMTRYPVRFLNIPEIIAIDLAPQKK